MKKSTSFPFPLLVVLSVLLAECGEAQPSISQQPQQPMLNMAAYLCTVKLPSKLSFCGEEVPLDIPEVRERAEREFYLTLQQAHQLILNVKRAPKYFPLFEHILKNENVPTDLKFLAVAESYLYMARSSRDAVGIWQFMEGTAKSYGLLVDEYVDERRHVEKSTKAAIQYLRGAFQKFGSWSLAAAAYNMGFDGVASNVELQKTSNYYDMYLNEETSRYVLRIVVWKEILEHPASYGISLNNDELYKADEYRFLKVPHAVENLARWCDANGYNYKQIKLLNPWILKRSLATPKNGAWEIAVPK